MRRFDHHINRFKRRSVSNPKLALLSSLKRFPKAMFSTIAVNMSAICNSTYFWVVSIFYFRIVSFQLLSFLFSCDFFFLTPFQDGKTSSAIMVSALLVFCKLFSNPSMALDMFSLRRCQPGQKIDLNPSQRR